MKALLSVALPVVLCLFVCVTPVVAAVTDGYVGNSNSDDVIPFDLTSYALSTAIPLPAQYPYPYDATMSPDSSEVWVADASGDHVVVIDVATNAITHTIPVGEYPNSVVFTDDGTTALVSSRGGDYIALIKTSTYVVTDSLYAITGSGGTYDGPGNMALCPFSGNIYAIDWYAETLFEISPTASEVLRTAEVASDGWQIVCDPAGRYVYVTDRSTDQVRVIDRATLTELTAVAVGDDPWGLDVTLDGLKLVVACEDDATVHVIDTTDWSTTVIALDASADPRDVDILDSAGYAYVPGGTITATDPVYVIELAGETLKDSFPVGGNPNVVAVQAQVTSATTGVHDGVMVPALRLECHPNPFNPRTTVRYHVPEPCHVELAVYDVSGRRVALLEEGPTDAGDHEASWNGVNDEGLPAATGVYFMRLDALGASSTIKSVLLK